MKVIQAREMLFALQVADYPKSTDKSRSAVYKDVRKKAFPNEKKKVMSFDQIGDFFNGRF
jgi:hypothetical protein